MTCRENPINRQGWIEYLDGTLDRAESAQLDLHLASCASCRKLRDRLAESRDRLQEAARQTDSSISVRPRSLSRIWDGLRFRIRRTAAAAEPAISPAQLRSIPVSICGAATAEDVLRTAELRSGHQESKPFARNLSSIVEVMSGDRAARLVEHAARLVRKERVA